MNAETFWTAAGNISTVKNAPERSHIGIRKTVMMAWNPWVESIRQARQKERAVRAEWGREILKRNRHARSVRELTNGPAKLCQAMGIDRKLDGAVLCDAGSPLFVAQNPEIDQFRVARGQTVTTTRIGITKAADLPLRFYLEQSPFVSGLRRG